jgi:hypothetical protein
LEDLEETDGIPGVSNGSAGRIDLTIFRRICEKRMKFHEFPSKICRQPPVSVSEILGCNVSAIRWVFSRHSGGSFVQLGQTLAKIHDHHEYNRVPMNSEELTGIFILVLAILIDVRFWGCFLGATYLWTQATAAPLTLLMLKNGHHARKVHASATANFRTIP